MWQVVPDAQLCMAKLALRPWFDLATERMAHLLQTITNAEDGEAQLVDEFPNFAVKMRSVLIIHGAGPAAQDYPIGCEGAHFLHLHDARPKLAIHAGLTNTAADKVAYLRPKVENQNSLLLQLLRACRK